MCHSGYVKNVSLRVCIRRRKKRVKNYFKGDYFIEKQEKIYVIEDEKGVFVPNNCQLKSN